MRDTPWLHPALPLFLLLLVLGGPPARAIPAPMKEDRLLAMASVAVEGRVVRVTYLRSETRGHYASSVYQAELRVERVLKGAVKPGSLITIAFSTERFVGPGRQPEGRSPQPAFYPCERVRAYLSIGKSTVYYTVYWNGRRSLTSPPVFKLPAPDAKVLRCVSGKVR